MGGSGAAATSAGAGVTAGASFAVRALPAARAAGWPSSLWARACPTRTPASARQRVGWRRAQPPPPPPPPKLEGRTKRKQKKTRIDNTSRGAQRSGNGHGSPRPRTNLSHRSSRRCRVYDPGSETGCSLSSPPPHRVGAAAASTRPPQTPTAERGPITNHPRRGPAAPARVLASGPRHHRATAATAPPHHRHSTTA